MFFRKTLFSSIIQVLTNISHVVFGLCLARFFGAQPEMDAYVAASNFIIALNALFVNSQINSFIPFISKYKDHPDRKNIVSSIIQTNIIIFSLLGIALFIFSKWVVIGLAPGLSPEQLAISSNIIKILSVFMLFSNFCGIGSALLDFNYKFVKRYLLALLQSLLALVVLIILFASDKGIFSTAYAHLFSFLFISLVYILVFVKGGYRFKSPLPLLNNYIKEYFYLLLPIAFSWFFVLLIRFTDVHVASYLKSGSISWLSYCQRITMYTSVISNVICSIYFPVLSKLSGPKDSGKFLITFYKGLQTLFVVSLGLSVFVFLFSNQIIEFLFEYRNFLVKDTVMVSKLLKYYGFVLLCAPLGSYFSMVYFSYRKTKLAMIISIISSSINIILNIILAHFFGVIGLAVASSIAFLSGNIMQILNINRINPEYRLLKALTSIHRTFYAGLISLFVFLFFKVYIVQFLFRDSFYWQFICLGICFLTFFLIYSALNYLFKVEVVKEVAQKLIKQWNLYK